MGLLVNLALFVLQLECASLAVGVCESVCGYECNRISLVPKRSSGSSINKNTNKFMEFLVQNFYLHKRIKNTGTTSDVYAATTRTRTTTAALWGKSKQMAKISSGYMYK